MTDVKPIVTGADLADLHHMRVFYQSSPTKAPLLDRLIAAAEADLPPLPEGWVLLDTTSGRRALWHEDGDLYEHDMLGGGVWGTVGSVAAPRDRLTPLRPTVTQEQVKAIAGALYVAPYTVRAALKAARIEVES